MQLIIEGVPIAKARARIVRRGSFSIAYDPQQKEKESVQREIIVQIAKALSSDDKQIVKDASNIASAEFFNVDMCFYMPIPKSLSKKKRTMLAGDPIKDSVYHNKKPDSTNIFKFYEDAANGHLFSDDSKIVKGSFVKKYSDNPRTVININPIDL